MFTESVLRAIRGKVSPPCDCPESRFVKRMVGEIDGLSEQSRRLLKEAALENGYKTVGDMINYCFAFNRAYGVCLNPDCEIICDSPYEIDADGVHCFECKEDTVVSVVVLENRLGMVMRGVFGTRFTYEIDADGVHCGEL